MQNNIYQATDKEAELLIATYNNGGKVYDNEVRGRNGGKIISIENDTCTIEYENGDIEKCQHYLFRNFRKINKNNATTI